MQNAAQRTMRIPRSRATVVGPLAGALLVATGAALPWLTLFAGLQRYTGLAGRNGQLVLAGGVAAFALAVVQLVRASDALRLATAALGAALVGFSAWLLVGLLTMVHRDASNPMLLARVGPGLFVVAAGALVVMITPLAARADHERVTRP